MNAGLSSTPGPVPRALLAKLVIGISTLVALASSPPPRWVALEQAQLHIVFDERNERTALVSIEIAGELYADTGGGTLEVMATADRTASDLVLSVHPLEPGADESDQAAEESDSSPAFDMDADVSTARPEVRSPNIASLSVPVECAERDPSGQRAERCSAQFEITLVRQSRRPLSVDLSAFVQLDGSRETEPPGTFQILLEELAP